MKNFTSIIFLLLLCLSSTYKLFSIENHFLITDSIPAGKIDGYWIHLPEKFEERSVEYPVLLFLHGASAILDSLGSIKYMGPVKVLYDDNVSDSLRLLLSSKFIIVNPHLKGQPREYSQWYDQSKILDHILDVVIEKYNGDPERIYLTGLSRGGRGTWGYSIISRHKLAAIIPICGTYDKEHDIASLKDIPIWITCNTGDSKVTYDAQLNAVKIIESSGGEPFFHLNNTNPESDIYLSKKHVFTSFKKNGHDAWTETYSSISIYKWLLIQN
jgi:predicted peptidase